MPTRVLILGATSAIAEAIARPLAAAGARFFLVARHEGRLAAGAEDLRVRGAAAVTTAVCDLAEPPRHAALVAEAVSALGGLDVALIAYGTLGDHAELAHSFAAVERHLAVNLTSAISLAMAVAAVLEAQAGGTLAVITSVAGDRGRASNYVYGTAKGALGIFLSGLRARLRPCGVHVMTIKPGMVDTPMTAALPKSPLFADADAVGAAVVRALARRQSVVYAPWYWRWIMAAIKALPEAVFMRLKF